MNNFIIEPCVVGMIGTNCYLVYRKTDQRKEGEYIPAAVIDPGDNAPYILNRCKELGVKPEVILLTHGHFDHILAAEDVRRALGIPVYAGEAEKSLLADADLNLSRTVERKMSLQADRWLQDGEILDLLGAKWKVIFTPGHTSGSVCYSVEDEQVLFSGDTMFCQSVGRTDFPTGNSMELIKSVSGLLITLPDETGVYPGHGERTTIGYERKRNPLSHYASVPSGQDISEPTWKQ